MERKVKGRASPSVRDTPTPKLKLRPKPAQPQHNQLQEEKLNLDRMLTWLGIAMSIGLTLVTIRPTTRIVGWCAVFCCLAHPAWHLTWWLYGRKASRAKHIAAGLATEVLLLAVLGSVALVLWPVEIVMIFKAAPTFTWWEKQKITFTAERYRNYLLKVGYDAPRRFPPLGVSPGIILTGGSWNGGFYSQTAVMSEENFKNTMPEQVRFVYGMDFFEFAFPETPLHEEGWKMALTAARIYSDYYRCSYRGSPDNPWSPPVELQRWQSALWSLRAR